MNGDVQLRNNIPLNSIRKGFHILVLKYYDMSMMQCHPPVALQST